MRLLEIYFAHRSQLSRCRGERRSLGICCVFLFYGVRESAKKCNTSLHMHVVALILRAHIRCHMASP